jgi:hypothetical protein
MIKPVLSSAEYAIERAICDKANAYWQANATFSKSGASSMSQKLAAHPDYAACDNDMRGRVEQFELLRDMPEKLTAYIGEREPNGMGIDRLVGRSYPVTVWTGLQIGNCTLVAHDGGTRWRFDKTFQCYATIGGREYTGRTQGVGMYVNLKETAASKRARAEKLAA